MPVQKIKSGRVLNPGVNQFIGEKGTIFFDEDVGELRLSDGHTPGGIPITSGGTGTFVLSVATTSTLGGVKVGSGLSVTPDGTLSAVSTATLTVNTFTNISIINFDAGLLVTNTGSAVTVSGIYSSNLDGGVPTSVYGGIPILDAGGI